MIINRIGMGFGLLKANMEGSLSVGRMGSVIRSLSLEYKEQAKETPQ